MIGITITIIILLVIFFIIIPSGIFTSWFTSANYFGSAQNLLTSMNWCPLGMQYDCDSQKCVDKPSS